MLSQDEFHNIVIGLSSQEGISDETLTNLRSLQDSFDESISATSTETQRLQGELNEAIQQRDNARNERDNIRMKYIERFMGKSPNLGTDPGKEPEKEVKGIASLFKTN